MSPDILRGRRLKKLNPDSVKYTASTDFDDILVNPVITINKAHMAMLVTQGVVKKTQGAKCLVGLNDITTKIILDPNLEDVHMNVEFQLIEKVGMDVGGQLNLAKSRNDQVSTAIRMALRSYLLGIMSSLSDLQSVILDKAKDNLETIMPSYTHLQHAQPTTLAHHLMAYHSSLQRDSERLADAYGRLNLNPLGSAALASTSIKIDRELTTHLLGFDGLVENSMDAVSSRDFAIEIISDLVLNMTNLSRMAEELVLWSSEEFDILDISDGYASTSSIMPQKKNAVVAELIRGKTSTVYGDMIASVSIMKSLPYSYNIDMQQLTPHIWSSCDITLTSIKEMKGMIEEVTFNVDRLAELLEDELMMATDLADYLVVKHCLAFRTAHLIVGSLVKKSVNQKIKFHDVILKDLSITAKQLGVENISMTHNEINKLLDPKTSIESKITIGGPNSSMVLNMIKNGKQNVKKNKEWISSKINNLKNAEKKLEQAISEIIGGESN